MSELGDLFGGSGGGGLGDLLGGLAGSATEGDGLDGILGSLTGGAGADDAGSPGGLGGVLSALVPMVGGMLSGGGLQRVLTGLEANGLGAQAASWVGRGTNQPVSAGDLERVLGEEQIADLAAQLGVAPNDAADAMSQALPAIVDDLTPDGIIPTEAEIDEGLRKLLGG